MTPTEKPPAEAAEPEPEPGAENPAPDTAEPAASRLRPPRRAPAPAGTRSAATRSSYYVLIGNGIWVRVARRRR